MQNEGIAEISGLPSFSFADLQKLLTTLPVTGVTVRRIFRFEMNGVSWNRDFLVLVQTHANDQIESSTRSFIIFR